MKHLSWLIPSLFFYGSLSHASLKSEVEAILNRYGQKSSFSLRDQTGKEILAIRPDLSLAPASIAKTVSTGCSLLKLTPAFQFETEFGFTGKIDQDTLKGDLVIRGHGDPALVIEDLREAIEKVQTLYKIKKIEGNLVFDVSYFGQESLAMAEGFEGDAGRSFSTDLTPSPFNQNSFSIWTAASYRSEGKTNLATLPRGVMDVDLKNETRLGKATAITVSYNPEKGKATVAGQLDADDGPKGVWRSVPDNYKYYGEIIKSLWSELGGSWKNFKSTTSKTPIAVQPLWTIQSKPLAKILMDVNKLSLNMGAELTLLAAGAKETQGPANYPKALQVVQQCLSDFAVPSDTIVLTNASGLSREARIKTSGLSLFLYKMQLTSYAPEYLASLSLVGLDGTGRTRMRDLPGQARIKTGSIAGVSSIAGYLWDKDHQSYTFALIMNGVNQGDPAIKTAQDEILTKVLKSAKSQN